MAELILVGSNHQLVPPSKLRAMAGHKAAAMAVLLELQSKGAINGGMLISTCNRVEAIVDPSTDFSESLATRLFGPEAAELTERHDDEDAVYHLLRVTTGLESMVIGEDQILGQVSRAFKEAEDLGLLSKRLHMLRARVLKDARDIRHNTGISGKRISMAGLAARRLMKTGKRLCVIGAGETGRLALETMSRAGVTDVLVVNRTLSKAEAVASHFGGTAMSLQDFLNNTPAVDAVLVAVNSPEPFLTPERTKQMKLVIDISQPCVIAPETRKQNDIDLYDLDDIQTLAREESTKKEIIATTSTEFVKARARVLWRELQAKRANLGKVIDMHVESALSEIETVIQRQLGHLAETDQCAIRQAVAKSARRHAHYHIQDLKQRDLQATP